MNAYHERNGDQVSWRRVPGLLAFCDTMQAVPRGMIDVGGTLYVAFDGFAVTVSSSGGTVTLLAGSLPGSGPVTWARNNKAPTPDVVCVTEIGTYTVTSTTVLPFADSDLPAVNSVTFLDGYFLWTTGDGQIWASALNDVAVDPLSFAKAEARPDGLLRGIVSGSQFFGFGPASLEIWSDAGTQPFPLSRTTVIPVGLLSPWAVAGFEDGWDLTPIFVAQDGTVRQMSGYQPVKISLPDVERAIQSVADKTQLRACVYVAAGHPVWVLTGPTFTWCFDAVTNAWFERESYGSQRWRASTSVKFSDRWIVGDRNSGKLFEVTETVANEDGDPLVWIVESGPVKQFPMRVRVPSAYFDFTTGQGNPLGTEDEVTPEVGVRWSHDGGATWSNELIQRSLGAQGDYRRLIRVNRLGRSTQHGIRFRLTFATDIYVNFRGGTMDALTSRN